MENLDRDTLT